METRKKITTFKDLVVWQKSHELALEVYRCTRLFPKEEIFGLRAQIRKSAVSVPSNIVEGFRRTGKKEKLQFYNVSQASLDELTYQLMLSLDLGYLSDKDILERCETVSRLLSRFISTTKANPIGKSN